MKLMALYHKYTPEAVKSYVRKHLDYYRLGIGKFERQNKQLAKVVGKKDKITVLFMAANVAMWRFQGLYELLKKDTRFAVYVIISPFTTYSAEAQRNDVEGLKKYFKDNHIEAIDATDSAFSVETWRNEHEVDIFFPVQQYGGMVGKGLNIEDFASRLVCIVPYSFTVTDKEWTFNNYYLNIAWRVYHPTPSHKKRASQRAVNHGKNVKVVGEPNADRYAYAARTDPWKVIGDGKSRRRIIWAPHFSINDDCWLKNRTSFIDLAEYMQEMSDRYKDTVQFAFKPHPRLFSELCRHKAWGSEKAREYYDFWKNSYNTQIDDGEYIDLFLTSDAMIHDCGSFTAEYMYVGKPVLFVSPDFDSVRAECNPCAQKCMDLHYRTDNADGVEDFVRKVVLNGEDYMKPRRIKFYNKVLKTPDSGSVAENIYNDILDSLGLKRN